MTEFNKKLLILFALIAALLTGCVDADEQDPSALNKIGAPTSQKVWKMSLTGETVSVEGYSDQIYSSGGIQLVRARDLTVEDVLFSQYPNHRHYQFKLCLQDIRLAGAIPNQTFMLYREIGPPKEVQLKLKENSCIHWDEFVDYNVFADAVNLQVNFIFKSKTEPKAYIHRMARLNPWDKKRNRDAVEFEDFTARMPGYIERIHKYGKGQQVWAVGVEDVRAALDGKYIEKNKKVLVIGNVTTKLLDKKSVNVNTVSDLPDHLNDPQIARDKYIVGVSLAEHREEVRKIHTKRLKEALGDDAEALQTLDLDLVVQLQDLKVNLFDSSGQPSPIKLLSGRYQVEAQVLATDYNSYTPKQILTRLIPFTIKRCRSNELKCEDTKTGWASDLYGVRAVIPISVVMRPTWGNLALAIKVTPLDLDNVEPFEQVYHMGRYDDLSQATGGIFSLSDYTLDTVKHALSTDYDDYLATAGNHAEWQQGRAEEIAARQQALEGKYSRFEFGILNILFGRVMPGDTATDRTVQYTASSCVTDTLTAKRLDKNNEFRVETTYREVHSGKMETLNVDVKTDPDGCIHWYGFISHKFFHREDLIRKISKITYLGDKNMPSYELDYYINPWDEKFTFGRDARVLSEKYINDIKSQQKFAPKTRLLITDFYYTTISFRYFIDKYMNLTVKKSALLEMQPKVLKYNSIIYGRSGLSGLRDGVYLLKVALQKDYLDPAPRDVHYNIYLNKENNKHQYSGSKAKIDKAMKKYLVIKEKLVRVLGGKIISPIQFEVDDLRLMRIRNHFLIQLETIDEGMLRQLSQISDGLQERADGAIASTTEVVKLLEDEEENIKKVTDLYVARFRGERAVKEKQVRAEYRERIAKVLPRLNKQNLELAVERIDVLRKLGQSPRAIVENIRYNTINEQARQKYDAVRGRLQEQYRQKARKAEEYYKISREKECLETGKRLRALRERQIQQFRDQGEQVKAEEMLAGLDKEIENMQPGGIDCSTDFLDVQSYYHVTTNDYVGTDEWAKSILSKDEYKIYQSGNLYLDFTTASYKPEYSFDFLSNQGDERDVQLAKDEYNITLTSDVPINENVSGLERRTFVGPLTILKSDNGSAIRPTDVLGEKDCMYDFTCSSLKNIEIRDYANSLSERAAAAGLEPKDLNKPVNWRYESSPFYGSVAHFYDVDVNDLIPDFLELDAYKKVENQFGGQMSNYLYLNQLQFVSMKNKTDGLEEIDFDCYENTLLEIKNGNIDSRLNESSMDCFGKITDRRVFKEDFTKYLKTDIKNYDDIMLKKDRKGRDDHEDMGSLDDNQLIEFAKNGFVSRKLNFKQKVAILHRMCAPLTYQLVNFEQMFEKSFSFKKNYQRVTGEDRKARLRSTHRRRFARDLMRDLRGAHRGSPLLWQDSLSDAPGNRCIDMLVAFEELVHKSIEELTEKYRAESVDKTPLDIEIEAIKANIVHSPILVDRIARIRETSGQYFYKDGKSLNYNVGANFNLTYSKGLDRKAGLDPLSAARRVSDEVLGLIGDAGDATGPKGKALKGIEKFGKILTAVSSMYNYSWGHSEGQQESNGTSVSEGTYLAAQISTLDIELKQWEKCSVIRFQPKYYNEFALYLFNEMKGGQIRDDLYDLKDDPTATGYVLCSGEYDTEDDMAPAELVRSREADLASGGEAEPIPLRIRERYIYFTQHFTEGDMQDPASLVNHPWMLQLRGIRDFSTFVQALKEDRGGVREFDQTQMWRQMTDDLGDLIGMTARLAGLMKDKEIVNPESDFAVLKPKELARPINMLAENYRKVLPSFPGIYNFIDAEGEQVTNWPADESETPHDQFEK